MSEDANTGGERMTEDQYRCFIEGVESVMLIRCIAHRSVPQYNQSESTGAECPACEIERLRLVFAGMPDPAAALATVRDALEEGIWNFESLEGDSDIRAIRKLRAALALLPAPTKENP